MKRKGGMKFFKKTLRDVPLGQKTVLVRADYNVPLRSDGTIADDFRIRASLPTLKYLLEKGCKVVIVSHLGRPEGKDPKLSLEPIANRLARLLGEPVRFVNGSVGDRVKMAIKRAPQRSVTVLENLRFYPEEEANDEGFAKRLASDTGARYFVQDGFGVVHRAHASTSAITLFLPSVAGLLLEKEVSTITEVMKHPIRPLVSVLGGAKVSDKIDIIEALIPISEKILIGGAMANTFLKAKGISVGASKCETDQDDKIKRIYQLAEKKAGAQAVDEFLVLPTDVAVATSIDKAAKRKNVSVSSIGDNERALDIGDATIETFVKAAGEAKTVIWNGTLGYAELPEFAHGSARLALALATHPDLTSVVGGGDTADFVLGWDSKSGGSFTHVSTGGGASLELMAGKKLPGVESLLDS